MTLNNLADIGYAMVKAGVDRERIVLCLEEPVLNKLLETLKCQYAGHDIFLCYAGYRFIIKKI